MKTSNVKALIITGDGINCERESSNAFSMVGANPTIMHINDLMENKSILDDFHLICLPGGFSFGDELGSGQILAHKIKYGLEQEFYRFVDKRKPIIGICNGFQVLTKLGLLPNHNEERTISLNHNEKNEFIDRWVDLKIPESSNCLWTKGIDKLSLPIRHGEGRVCFPIGKENQIYEKLIGKGQIAMTYEKNPNGSSFDIAGICDEHGLIFGLMPHPEAAVSLFSHREGEGLAGKNGAGLEIFKNIMETFK